MIELRENLIYAGYRVQALISRYTNRQVKIELQVREAVPVETSLPYGSMRWGALLPAPTLMVAGLEADGKALVSTEKDFHGVNQFDALVKAGLLKPWNSRYELFYSNLFEPAIHCKPTGTVYCCELA